MTKHREVEWYETFYQEDTTSSGRAGEQARTQDILSNDECTCASCTKPPCPICTDDEINDALGG